MGAENMVIKNLFAVIAVMSLCSASWAFADSPLLLPKFKFAVDSKTAIVEGTWVARRGTVFDFGGEQTSTIACYRSRMLCIESRAWKNPRTGALMTVVLDYRINKWDEDQIQATLNPGYLGAGGDRLEIEVEKESVLLARPYREGPPAKAWMKDESDKEKTPTASQDPSGPNSSIPKDKNE
jgi:hypothetical protein